MGNVLSAPGCIQKGGGGRRKVARKPSAPIKNLIASSSPAVKRTSSKAKPRKKTKPSIRKRPVTRSSAKSKAKKKKPTQKRSSPVKRSCAPVQNQRGSLAAKMENQELPYTGSDKQFVKVWTSFPYGRLT